MTYNPTNWKDQIVTDPTKYKITKEDGTKEVVNIEREPGEIIQEGTRITADKLNNIEEGIKGAADLVNDLAGEKRTKETVKGNAEDIGGISAQMAELAEDLDAHETKDITSHNVSRGVSTFAGAGQEVIISHGLSITPTSAYVFPTVNPEGYLGEVWIRIDETNLYIGNSGSFTGEMSWVAIG